MTGWQAITGDEEGFLGAEEVSAAGDRLRLWFASAAARRRATARLTRYFESQDTATSSGAGGAGPQASGVSIRQAPAEAARDWTARFREFFGGVRAGGFFVHPPGVPAPAGLIPLRLTPGAAFGTGMHATTRMVLELLEEHLRGRRSRARVLDIGTGSGILAVAAAILGARPVIGLDRDPEAIHCAGGAAAANGQAARVRFHAGDYRDRGVAARLDAASSDGFDLILANLSPEALVDLPDFAAARLRRRGRLVVSGFLRADASRILAPFLRSSLRVAEIRTEVPEPPQTDRWLAAALKRRRGTRDAPPSTAAAGTAGPA